MNITIYKSRNLKYIMLLASRLSVQEHHDQRDFKSLCGNFFSFFFNVEFLLVKNNIIQNLHHDDRPYPPYKKKR